MTAADEACRIAERLVEEARESGAETLSFDREDCRALDRLPDGIAGLTGLTELSLDGTQVSDLSQLGTLTGLTKLGLRGTQVSDLAPLRELTGLTELSLNGTQVSDLSPIEGLTELSWLSLNNTLASDLSPLEGLTKLTVLWLVDTQVSDLLPLAGKTALAVLALSGTRVGDISPLEGLTGLKWLWLNGTQVRDLSPIGKLTGLSVLRLSNTLVSDPSPIAGITKLKELWLSGTQVNHLSPLATLTGLTELLLIGIPATDLRSLCKLTRLATEPKVSGLTFKDTGATRVDPRIAEIAEIRDNAERARVLFDYLEGWEPPVPALPPADRTDVPAYELPDQGAMRSLDPALGPATDEQEELRQDLVGKANRLIVAIGPSNELADLRGIAEHYLGRISRPLSDIRLQLLYSAANALRTAYEAHAQAEREERVNDILPPKIAGALRDIVEVQTLFFMGFPEGAAIQERVLRGLPGRREKESYEDEEKIVRSLKERPKALDPVDLEALEDDLAAAKGAGPSAEIGARRLKGRLWNMLGAAGRKVIAGGKWGVSSIARHDFIAWLMDNQTVIGRWLEWAQGQGAVWFQRVIEMLRGSG